jgi:hypothetical protein
LVDVANDLKTALDLIDAKTYHAALVDIMLAGPHDRTDRGGLRVLRRLGELNEGTRAIVLSGQDEPQLSADTLQEYKAVWFLQKTNILRQGLKLVTDKVAEVLEGVSLLRYGRRGGKSKGEEIGVLTFMSGGSSDEAIWIDRCLRSLKPAGGYAGLRQFLETFCEPLLPLFPRTTGESPMIVKADQRYVLGDFWSKALGQSISLYVRNTDDSPPDVSANQALGKVISEHNASHLSGCCYELRGGKRADFVATFR